MWQAPIVANHIQGLSFASLKKQILILTPVMQLNNDMIGVVEERKLYFDWMLKMSVMETVCAHGQTQIFFKENQNLIARLELATQRDSILVLPSMKPTQERAATGVSFNPALKALQPFDEMSPIGWLQCITDCNQASIPIVWSLCRLWYYRKTIYSPRKAQYLYKHIHRVSWLFTRATCPLPRVDMRFFGAPCNRFLLNDLHGSDFFSVILLKVPFELLSNSIFLRGSSKIVTHRMTSSHFSSCKTFWGFLSTYKMFFLLSRFIYFFFNYSIDSIK